MINSQTSTRIVDPTAGLVSSIDYTKLPREVLEQKARLNDAIELNMTAVHHGCMSMEEFYAWTMMTFERAEFKNYFNQEHFHKEKVPDLKLVS